MSPRVLPKSTKLSHDIEHFFDVVARLLAKRWLREQQSQMPANETRDEGMMGSARSNTD